MQHGFYLLWFLCVGASVLAWVYLEIALAIARGFESRRQITGCELASQLLDRNDLHQTPIQSVPGVGNAHSGLDFDRLLLAEKVYYGTRLSDLALAFHVATHLLIVPKSFVPVELRAQMGRYLRYTLLGSWLLILGGAFHPAWSWMTHFGRLLFVLLGFRALASLGEEWEVTERAVAHLSSLEGLGTDERVRIKQVLKALQWGQIAELFGGPLSLFFQNKKRIPACPTKV